MSDQGDPISSQNNSYYGNSVTATYPKNYKRSLANGLMW